METKPLEHPEDIAPAGRGDGQSRVDWIVEMLSNDIVNGVLEPGVKISEPGLSRRFGLSRAPIREAIRRLEERRLVVSRQNLGARVATFTTQDFVELFHVREGLEGIAARLAAERITDAEVVELKALLDQQVANLAHSETARSLDLEFHRRLGEASRSPVLTSILGVDFYNLFKICRRNLARFPGRPERAFREHIAIIEAVEMRDSELAEYLTRKHVAGARSAFERVLGEEWAQGGAADNDTEDAGRSA